MAITRDMEYVFKWGELSIDSDNRATYAYLGGSPVTIKADANNNALISGNCTDENYFGVAYHSMDEDYALEEQATVIFAPAILTLEAESINPLYDSYGKKPWKTWGSPTYAVGDKLHVIAGTGTVSYSLWTNDAYAGSTNEHQVYFAKLISFTGTAGNPTTMTILLGTFINIY